MPAGDDDKPQATVLPLAENPDGSWSGQVFHEDGRVTLGRFSAVEPDTEVKGTLVALTDRPGTPFYDATYPFGEAAPRAPASHKGPAKVSSEAYRDGWERIFGRKTAGEA